MKFLTCCALVAIAISAPCNAFAETSGEPCDHIGETRLATGGNDIIACLADVPDGTTGHYKSQVYTTPKCKHAFSDVVVRRSYNNANLVYQDKDFYIVTNGANQAISINTQNEGYGAHYHQPPTNPGDSKFAVAAECDGGWIKTSCEIVAGGDGTPAGQSSASDTICGGGNSALGNGWLTMRAGITCCKAD